MTPGQKKSIRGTGKAARDTIKKLLREGGRTVSDADRQRADQLVDDLDYYLKKNDGGMVSKTRTY
jgi:hypothetical protein